MAERSPMKRTVQIGCAAAFVLICILTVTYLQTYTRSDTSLLEIVRWQAGEIVDTSGHSEVFDSYSEVEPFPPFWRMSLRMPICFLKPAIWKSRFFWTVRNCSIRLLNTRNPRKQRSKSNSPCPNQKPAVSSPSSAAR